jgi:hypothetical protein
MSKTLPAVFVIAFITIAATTAGAQTSNQGNPTILDEVRVLQSSVDALASQLAAISNVGGNVTTQLTAIATQLTALTNTVNALATPPAAVSTGFSYKPVGYSAGCSAQNVGTSPVTVTFELLKLDGLVQQSVSNQVLAAGHAGGFTQSVGSAGNHFWCRISMLSGSSANLRANMDIINEATGFSLVTREAR